MAKVYSWEVVKSSVYAYIYNPIEDKGAYVGPELKGDNLDKIINWTATVSDEVYDEHFDLMVKLCKEKGYDVNFDLAYAYRNVIGSCDNLRGPAGRGIESIYYRGTVLDEFNRNVDYYGIRYDDGTEDENGFYIRNGFDGKDGKDGIDGVNGIMGLSSITMIVYTSTEDETPPNRPVGGFYWFETGTFDCPDGWYVNDDNLSGVKWISTKVFMSNNQNNPWSTPIRISGKDGENGRDGDTIEFIYKLGDDVNRKPQKPENNKDINDYIPEGWLDHPQGVDENNTVEWMCNRTKNTDVNGDITWGDWSEPIAWSVFGVNGVDGDGIQYIFLKNRGEMPVNPTPENWENMESAYQEKYAEFIPPVNESYTNKDGISIIFKPVKNVENNIDMGDAYVWTDSPSTLNTIYQYQWVSVRKYRNGKWTEYSKPALWGKYGENGTNGTAIIKIYKTHNSFNEPPTPPNSPTILGDWSMGFPKDYELGKNVVYSTECEVYLDSYEFVYRYKKIEDIDVTEDIIEKAATVESIPTDKYEDNDYIYCYDTYYYWSGGWCKPYIVTGVVGENGASSKLIVIYTNKNEGEIPETPKGGDYDFDKFEFLYCPKDWYTSDDEFYGITWMSTRTFSSIKEYTDEEWSTPIRLTGERGVENKFFMIYTQSPEQPETPEDGAYDFSTRIFTCPEGWYINDDNFIDDPDNENYSGYTWMSTRTFSSIPTTTENNDDKWSTPVRLTGDNGKDGEDGETIEFIFKKSDREPTVSDKPKEPTDVFENDYVPEAEGWSDHPNGVTEELPYEWMCTRTRSKEPNDDGKFAWGEWSNPVIWSKYGVNGKDGDGVEYIYIRTITNETPKNPTPKDWKDRQGNYQKTNIEYLPPIGTEYTNKNGEICEWINDGDNNNIWTDSPLDITEKFPYIWVCTRKKKSAIVKKGGDSDLVEYIYQPVTDINKPPKAPQSINIANNTPNEWFDDYNLEESPAWWFCKRDKMIDINGNEVWGEWSEPSVWEKYEAYDLIKLWQPFSDPKLWSRFAYDGDDGKDGETIEFIFKKSDREPTVSDKPKEPTDVFENDYVPEAEGWSDHPNGVTEELPYEWMCTRTRSKEPNDDGKFAWGEWSNPVIWSKYGVNGKDGDGVQYIFFKTRERDDKPNNPTPENWENMESAYQEKYAEYLPPIGTEYTNINGETCKWSDVNSNRWYDSAPEVDEDYMYIWMCARKYRSVEVDTENTDGEITKSMVSRWEAYSDPKLWTKYPEKGLDGPQGPAGIPGVSINFMFCLGTKEKCFGKNEIKEKNSNNPGDYLYWFDNKEIPLTQFHNIEVDIKDKDIKEEEDINESIPRIIHERLENLTQYDLKGRVIEVKVNVNVSTTNYVEYYYYYFLKKSTQDGIFYIPVTTEIKEDETNSVYLWCVQGREKPEKDDATKIIVEWGKPFLLQGANGLKGMDGKNAPVIYPMGIYDRNTTYEATAVKQPYVYDGSDEGGFYLYNDLNKQWIGVNEVDETPARHVKRGGTRWVVFEQFELLWSNVGVINNGLIGSAVFNNNFMFSQQGKDKDGNYNDKYENFLNGYTFKDGYYSYNNKTVEFVDPYAKNDSNNFIHDFMPNVCINFSTGDFWAGYGRVRIADKVYIEKDLFGKIGNFPEIDENGNILWHHKPEEESTGIFEGLFSKETMEKFLGKPSLWDEKKDAFTGGEGLLGVVTPQLNKIKPEKFKWNGDNGEFESVNPNTNNISVSGLNDFLKKYLGKPGSNLDEGSGLFQDANKATINTLGTLPEVDDKGGITAGNGLLGELGDTLVKHTNYKDKTLREYIGTPPSNNANGTMSRGSGILSATTKTIEEYIGTPTEFDANGVLNKTGRGLMLTAINQFKKYVGTLPKWNSNNGLISIKGTGVFSGLGESISSYVGLPPMLFEDGSITKGTGIFRGFEDSFTAYGEHILKPYKKLGSPGYIDSAGVKVPGTGLLAGLTSTTNNSDSLSIKNLNVEGFLLKQPTTLTEAIIKAIKSDYKNGQYLITKESLGSYIIIDSNVNLIVNIYLPGINGPTMNDLNSRMYIGEIFQIYNYSDMTIGMSGCIMRDGTIGSIPLGGSCFAIFKCVCKTNNDNKQLIVWELESSGSLK